MIKKLFDLSIHHEDQRIIILDYFRGLLMILVLLQHGLLQEYPVTRKNRVFLWATIQAMAVRRA